MVEEAEPATLDEVAAEAGERAVEIERPQRLPPDPVDRLIATGRSSGSLCLPGAEAHVREGVDAIEAVSFHDGTTRWCVMIAVTTGLTAGLLPPEPSREIFGQPDAVAGGDAMPSCTDGFEEAVASTAGQYVSWGY